MFGRLFATLFTRKIKKANYVLLVQLIAAIAITVLSFTTSGHVYFGRQDLGVFPSFFMFVLFFSFIAALALYCITCNENESINVNQSLRLLPISDSKYYLDNIFTSIATLAYFACIEAIGIGISFLLAFQFDGTFHSEFMTSYEKSSFVFNVEDFIVVIQSLILLVLFCLLFYLMLSFLNFSSQAIISFLPGSIKNKSLLGFIRVFLVFILIWALVKGIRALTPIFDAPFAVFFQSTSSNDLLEPISIFICFDLLFIAINLFLFNQYIEPKEKK